VPDSLSLAARGSRIYSDNVPVLELKRRLNQTKGIGVIQPHTLGTAAICMSDGAKVTRKGAGHLI